MRDVPREKKRLTDYCLDFARPPPHARALHATSHTRFTKRTSQSISCQCKLDQQKIKSTKMSTLHYTTRHRRGRGVAEAWALSSVLVDVSDQSSVHQLAGRLLVHDVQVVEAPGRGAEEPRIAGDVCRELLHVLQHREKTCSKTSERLRPGLSPSRAYLGVGLVVAVAVVEEAGAPHVGQVIGGRRGAPVQQAVLLRAVVELSKPS